LDPNRREEVKEELKRHIIEEPNKDSIEITFREKKNGTIMPTGFKVKVYGDFGKPEDIEKKLEEAILLGHKMMRGI